MTLLTCTYLYCTKSASYNFGILFVNVQTCWWQSFCGLAALLDTFRREDCICQCVNTPLLQPCMPRHNEAQQTLNLQFLCSVMHCLSLLCRQDDIGDHMLLYVQLHGGKYLWRQGYDAPHMCTDAKSKLPFHFHHQGNTSTVQPTNKGYAVVDIKVKIMCMLILLPRINALAGLVQSQL